MGLIQGIHHVALLTTPAAFDGTVKFYTELLGLETVRAWSAGDSRAVMVSTGDNSVLEIMSNAAAEMPEGAFAHVAFATDHVDELAALVREAGYPITVEPKDVDIASDPVYPVRIAFCKGHAGEIIEFFHVK